jgi:hypothetical protein
MDELLDRIETLLAEQVRLHEGLLELIQQKKQALRSASAGRVAELCRLENEKVQLISEAEKLRLTLVAEATKKIAPDAAAPLNLRELAERLPEPRRGKLLVLRMELRNRMERVRDEAAVVRRATEALLRHMQGLAQTIGGAVTGVATYTRRGDVTPAVMAIRTFSATA